jgi:hypothetical protein
MTWNRATWTTLLASIACIVGGSLLAKWVSLEGGVALVAVGGALAGWLRQQPTFARGQDAPR